jgi:hypothetical protein
MLNWRTHPLPQVVLTSGMASLFAITEDGSTLEIDTVGSEGFIGVPILHQVGMAVYRVTVQMPTTAFCIEANGFLSGSNREGTLRTVLSRYAHVVETHLVQAVVCGLTHTVEQRLARGLMVMSDCLNNDKPSLTAPSQPGCPSGDPGVRLLPRTQEQLSIIPDRHRNRISEAGIVLKHGTHRDCPESAKDHQSPGGALPNLLTSEMGIRRTARIMSLNVA